MATASRAATGSTYALPASTAYMEMGDAYDAALAELRDAPGLGVE